MARDSRDRFDHRRRRSYSRSRSRSRSRRRPHRDRSPDSRDRGGRRRRDRRSPSPHRRRGRSAERKEPPRRVEEVEAGEVVEAAQQQVPMAQDASKEVKFADAEPEEYQLQPEEDYKEDDLQEVEAFLMAEENDGSGGAEEELDEEEKARRAMEERRRRREEIARKYEQDKQKHKNVEQHKDEKKEEEGEEPARTASRSTSQQGPGKFSPVTISQAKAILEDNAMQELQKDVQEEIGAVGAFDIFSSTPPATAGAALQPLKLATAALDHGDTEHLQSNWDDHEGYYKAMVGEVIDNRYRVLGTVGKGVFSTVLKCVDLAEDGAPVAMKLIRNNDTMRKAAQKELELLTEIAARDPTGRKHCVRLLASLEHRNHIGFVFEAMQMNLRDALKKFGKNVGINIGSVRIYGRQLFYALRHLAQLRIVHADIKPDNILVSDDLKHVKICDFGSAFRETDIDNDPTPYLVSRFYRAPEIILGLPYNRMIDMWSVGTCLYELFTGQVMFPAPNNNQMLKLMMDVKGRFPNKLVKSHLRAYEMLGLDPHFTPDYKFKHHELDRVTKQEVLRLIDITEPTVDLQQRLLAAKAATDDRRSVIQLSDLLQRVLMLDPAKRMTVEAVFDHPFVALPKPIPAQQQPAHGTS